MIRQISKYTIKYEVKNLLVVTKKNCKQCHYKHSSSAHIHSINLEILGTIGKLIIGKIVSKMLPSFDISNMSLIRDRISKILDIFYSVRSYILTDWSLLQFDL